MPTYTNTMSDVITFLDAQLDDAFIPNHNNVHFVDSMQAWQTSTLRDRVAMTDNSTAISLVTSFMSDEVAFATAVHLAYTDIMSNLVEFTTTAEGAVRAFGVLEDRLILSGAASSVLHARAIMASAILMADSMSPALLAQLSDTVDFVDAVINNIQAIAALSDSVELTDTGSGVLRVLLTLEDSVVLNDELSLVGHFIDRLNDGVILYSLMNFHGQQFNVWVMSPDTEAVWKYENFNFNSYTLFDGHYYGANDDGLFLLEGDDDAGTNIDAYVRTGLMDLGTGLAKQMSRAYLGYTASGSLVLKTVTIAPEGEFKGRKIEDWYELTRTSTDYREGRVPIGRGIESVYWQFVISNKLGSDFATDGIKLYPLVTDRRIK